MAGIGAAAYSVFVEFGIRNKMAQGMREVQAQLKAAQTRADAIGKTTAERLKVVQNHAARYGTIFGNPKSYAEAKRNLDAIQRQKTRLLNNITLAESASRRAAMQDQLAALRITERDVRERVRGFKVTQDQARVQEVAAARAAKDQERARVNEARSQYRIFTASERERREQDRALKRRQQQYHNLSNGAFKVAEYSGIGALAIGGGLFEAGKSAAQQQQLAGTTAMVLGLRGTAFSNAMQTLMANQLRVSMDVGMLSSADIAAIQTQLAMHTPGLGLKGLLNLTPFVAKYADVMKMTLGESPEDSAKTAAMAANIFGARSPKAMRDFLNRFFVMEQSTGVSQDTAVKALTQYGAMGKALGFSPQDMLDLYGQAFRLGAGGGKAGARLAAVMRGLGTIPTSVIKDYFERQLGLVGTDGIPTVLKQHGQIRLDSFLQGLHGTYERLIRRDGTARGKAEFITGLNASYGAAASNVLFPMIQSGSLKQFEEQKKRESQFYSIEQAQATFFHMPINEYQRMLTNFKSFVIEFGVYILPRFNDFFTNVADKLQHWTEWMQKHPTLARDIVNGLVKLAETLAVISALSLTLGTVAKIASGVAAINAFLKAIGAGSTVLDAFQAAAGRAAVAGDTLAGAEGKAAGAASTFGIGVGKTLKGLGIMSASLALIAVTYEFLKGLKINANMQKTNPAPPPYMNGPYGNNYAAPPPGVGPGWVWDRKKNAWEPPPPILAPTHEETHVHVHHLHVSGKKIATVVTHEKNRAMPGAIKSTTYGQGTRYMSTFQTRSNLNSPKAR